MQVTSQIAVVLLDVCCRAWTNKTRESASCEECEARRLRRLQGEHDTSKRARDIQVVDRSKSSFYIYFSVWCCWSVYHFERAWSARQPGIVPGPAVSVPHLDGNADRRWARQARSALFFCILGGIRPSYSWILACVELERIKKGQHWRHFPIGVVSKLAYKFLPDNTFFITASKRLTYRSYYCCVSFPFGSVSIALYCM